MNIAQRHHRSDGTFVCICSDACIRRCRRRLNCWFSFARIRVGVRSIDYFDNKSMCYDSTVALCSRADKCIRLQCMHCRCQASHFCGGYKQTTKKKKHKQKILCMGNFTRICFLISVMFFFVVIAVVWFFRALFCIIFSMRFFLYYSSWWACGKRKRRKLLSPCIYIFSTYTRPLCVCVCTMRLHYKHKLV